MIDAWQRQCFWEQRYHGVIQCKGCGRPASRLEQCGAGHLATTTTQPAGYHVRGEVVPSKTRSGTTPSDTSAARSRVFPSSRYAVPPNT